MSSCGFSEPNHFDALIATFKQIATAGEHEYLGEIIRPAAGLMELPHFQERTKIYYELLRQAGKQLIEKNRINHDTHEKLHQGWITPDDFMDNANAYFKSVVPKTE